MSRKARLNQAGDTVLCWHCKREIARVVEIAAGERDDPNPRRTLCFGPGWEIGDDGVWYLPERQQKRIRQGREPRQRRNLDGSHHRDEARLFGRAPFNLPVEARCLCDWRNELDPDELRVRRRRIELRPINRMMPDGTLKLVDPDPWDLCPYERW